MFDTRRSLFTLLTLLLGCGEGAGSVKVFLEAEETIPDGLSPGTGDEDIVDGYRVTYDRFLISFGKFRASRSADPGSTLGDTVQRVHDMKALPEGGLVIFEQTEVAATRWDRVGFDMPLADDTSVCGEGTAPADCAAMKSGRLSLWIGGRIVGPGTSTQAVSFDWPLQAGVRFDGCAPPTGDAGFAVPSGGTVNVKPTIHGDHWFFTNVTQGAEITKRCAGWVVRADRDGDGRVTLDELRATPAAVAFPGTGECAYNLSGAGAIASAYDYLVAQARTLGDYQGDGECPDRVPLSP